MAFRPSLKKKRQLEEAEANITPVMNLICILIPLLLSTAKFVDIALLEYTPPLIQEPEEEMKKGAGSADNSHDLLELRVNVAYQGLEVSIFNATSGDNYTMIPLREDGSYDFGALRRRLVEIKEQVVGPPLNRSREFNPETGMMEIVEEYKYPDANQIRISAESDIPLQAIIKVLDASREYRNSHGIFQPLFPAPALGQFQ